MANVDELLNNVPYDKLLSQYLYAASTHGCTCLACFSAAGKLRQFFTTMRDPNIAEFRSLQCRMPGCDWASRIWDTDHKTTMHGIPQALIHERTQFGQPGKYTCAEKDGGLANQRWFDFLRHATTRHHANAEEKKFLYTVVGCKYDGGNGFRRKDKLKNHQAKAFKAYLVPGQALQSIKPYQH